MGLSDTVQLKYVMCGEADYLVATAMQAKGVETVWCPPLKPSKYHLRTTGQSWIDKK
jgi:hypothetical protein